ncbi:3'-5' exonuclease, partial [Bacteroidota bacterium]
KIFHLMEKRTLSAAYKFYCQKDHENAHSALADTEVTLDVLEAQVQRYEGQDAVDLQGNKLGIIENDMGKLHALTNSNMVDLAGRIVYNENGEEIYNFGKHKGKLVVDVFNEEPQYYDWIIKNDFPLDTKRKLTQIKLRSYNR